MPSEVIATDIAAHGDQTNIRSRGDGVGLVRVERVELGTGAVDFVVAGFAVDPPEFGRSHLYTVCPLFPVKAMDTGGLIQAHGCPEIQNQRIVGIEILPRFAQQIGDHGQCVAFILNHFIVGADGVDAGIVYAFINIPSARFEAVFSCPAGADILPKEERVCVVVKTAAPIGERPAGSVGGAVEPVHTFFRIILSWIIGIDQMLRRHGERFVQKRVHVVQPTGFTLLTMVQCRGEVQHMLELMQKRRVAFFCPAHQAPATAHQRVCINTNAVDAVVGIIAIRKYQVADDWGVVFLIVLSVRDHVVHIEQTGGVGIRVNIPRVLIIDVVAHNGDPVIAVGVTEIIAEYVRDRCKLTVKLIADVLCLCLVQADFFFVRDRTPDSAVRAYIQALHLRLLIVFAVKLKRIVFCMGSGGIP